MARLSLGRNPKFRVLLRRLGLPEPYLRGHLEMLWESSHECGPVFKDYESVEAISGWMGEPTLFARTLVELRWLDETADGDLVIHDYDDHKPPWVKNKERKAEYRLRKSQDNDGTVTGQSRDNDGTVTGPAHQDKSSQVKSSEAKSSKAELPEAVRPERTETATETHSINAVITRNDPQWRDGLTRFVAIWNAVPGIATRSTATQVERAALAAQIPTSRWPALIDHAKRWRDRVPSEGKRESILPAAHGYLRDGFWDIEPAGGGGAKCDLCNGLRAIKADDGAWRKCGACA